MASVDIVGEVMRIIQDGYGDASQTVLDQRVAGRIVDHLRNTGWISPDEVRALVAGAGGRISVPISTLMDPPGELLYWDDPANDARVVATR